MNIIVYPSTINGKISAPPSKSVTHRALIIASLTNGTSRIRNALICDDTIYTINALKKLGIEIKQNKNDFIIKGGMEKLKAPKTPIDLGDSGSSLRMLCGVAALTKETIILTGSKRLCKRPMKDLLNALNLLGIKTNSKDGFPPIEIKGGKIKGGKIEISGKISSQYITSILMVAPFAEKPVVLVIKDFLKSKPYVALTLDLMQKFGVKVKNNNFKSLEIPVANYKSAEYRVEGDYSSASYFLAAAAISGGKLEYNNLKISSSQGDKYFVEILEKMGTSVLKNDDEIVIKGNPSKLHGVNLDMGNFPDLVPTLAIVAACAKGKTKIKNISHLKHKESNRINGPASELKKMSINTDTDDESLTIEGGKVRGSKIETYNDHRMAMAFTILGSVATGETIIKNAEVVSKSYPNFFDDFEKIGGKIKRT